jgi:Flp pilus assembly pilin Flp
MKSFISAFLTDEDGAITVDFVVLTAAICTLGLVVVTSFSGSATDLANKAETALDNMDAG